MTSLSQRTLCNTKQNKFLLEYLDYSIPSIVSWSAYYYNPKDTRFNAMEATKTKMLDLGAPENNTYYLNSPRSTLVGQ